MADGIKAGEIIIFELIIILESSLHESEENNDLLEVTIKETIVRIMIIFKIGYFCQNIFSDRLLFRYPFDYEMADGIKAGEIIGTPAGLQ